MQQAILLLAHKDYDQIAKLIAYFDGRCPIYVHVDKKSELVNRANEIMLLPGVKGVYSKYSVNWAGYSILQAELLLMKHALTNSDAYYFHLISGQDYPLRPLEDFLSFFDNTGSMGFLYCSPLPNPRNDDNTFFRLQHYVLTDYINTRSAEGKRRVWDFVRWQKRHGIRRRIPDYTDHLYIGSAWFSLRKEVVEYIVDYTRRHPAFYRRLRFTYIPEEIYVSSVALDPPYSKQIGHFNNCRTILWQHGEGIDCSPIDITTEQFPLLLQNELGFFARKFDWRKSKYVVEWIDRYLIDRHEMHIGNNGGWTSPWLDGYEFDIGLLDTLRQFCHNHNLTTVCDLGCGPGWYVAMLRRYGISAIGYDANPHTSDLSRLMTNGEDECICLTADLTEGLTLSPPLPDLLLCVDVGEYIPDEKEHTLIANLMHNAGRYLIVCWDEKASKIGSINPHDGEWLKKQLCHDGLFIHNEVATRFFRQSCRLHHHRSSLMVFQRV